MSLADLLLYFFGAAALAGGVLLFVARHPMRAALALIGAMISLAGIYAILHRPYPRTETHDQGT